MEEIFPQISAMVESLTPMYTRYFELIQFVFGLLLIMIGVSSVRSIRRVKEKNSVSMYSELHENIANPIQTIDSALRAYRLQRQTNQIAADVELDLAFRKLGEIESAAKAIQMRAQYNAVDSRNLLGPVVLQLTLENAISKCIEYAEENEVHINYRSNDFAGVVVYGRQDYLETVFVELIRNAIKYRDPVKKYSNILICGNMSRKHITTSIEDNGLGMSSKRVRSLGRRYQRPSVRKAHVEGSGTGLKNINTMVHVCDGSIDWSSLENEGTKADVKLRRLKTQIR